MNDTAIQGDLLYNTKKPTLGARSSIQSVLSERRDRATALPLDALLLRSSLSFSDTDPLGGIPMRGGVAHGVPLTHRTFNDDHRKCG
jgi:hypothetical protein